MWPLTKQTTHLDAHVSNGILTDATAVLSDQVQFIPSSTYDLKFGSETSLGHMMITNSYGGLLDVRDSLFFATRIKLFGTVLAQSKLFGYANDASDATCQTRRMCLYIAQQEGALPTDTGIFTISSPDFSTALHFPAQPASVWITVLIWYRKLTSIYELTAEVDGIQQSISEPKASSFITYYNLIVGPIWAGLHCIVLARGIDSTSVYNSSFYLDFVDDTCNGKS